METTKPAPAIVRQAEDAERRWFLGGGTHTWPATESETGGAFLLFEDEMTQGKVTPMHTHPESDESMYVLSGEILMNVDGAEHRLGAGCFVMVPRGVPHAFMVLSVGARLLCLHTRGSAQAFYLGASELLHKDEPGFGVVDFDRVRESGRVNGGLEILGPPPFNAP
ncbi:cupin domain-containing protein [Micrococcaceae bacterium Sec5.7]